MQVIDGLQIRDGGAADLPELRRILIAANEIARPAIPPSTFEAYLEMVLALEERLDVAELIVVSDGDRPVGTVTFFPDASAEGWGWPGGLAGIRAMGVDPVAQGRGAGSALLDECRRRARANGASGIVLHTAHFLPAAIRLYERHGYVRDVAHGLRGVQVMHLPDPTLDFEVLAYRLSLP